MLPLIRRHVRSRPEQVAVLAPEGEGLALAGELGHRVLRARLERETYAATLDAILAPGDVVLNLASNVRSFDVLAHCQSRGVVYVDTANEVWETSNLSAMATCDRVAELGALRAELQRRLPGDAPTAIVGHGCNPGIISHFCKQALLDLQARDVSAAAPAPATREEWAALAHTLRVRTVIVSERDSQQGNLLLRTGELFNTWCTESIFQEMGEAPNFASGTHEPGGRGAVRRLPGSAAMWRVRSWEPSAGPFLGSLVPHSETFTIADYLSSSRYRPTVVFVYQPCPSASFALLDIAGRDWTFPGRSGVLRDEILVGSDNVGILVFREGHPGAYWYGSRLDIEEARRVAPHTNATSLQVAAGALGGLAWALENPRRGLCNPEDLDHEVVLRVARPYLGELGGVDCPWSPSSRLALEDFLVEPALGSA